MTELEYQKLVGAEIRKARNAAKISQESAADATGIDRAFYGRVERGQTNLSLRSLLKISMALKIQPSSLLPFVQYDYTDPIPDKASQNSR